MCTESLGVDGWRPERWPCQRPLALSSRSELVADLDPRMRAQPADDGLTATPGFREARRGGRQ